MAVCDRGMLIPCSVYHCLISAWVLLGLSGAGCWGESCLAGNVS